MRLNVEQSTNAEEVDRLIEFVGAIATKESTIAGVAGTFESVRRALSSQDYPALRASAVALQEQVIREDWPSEEYDVAIRLLVAAHITLRRADLPGFLTQAVSMRTFTA